MASDIYDIFKTDLFEGIHDLNNTDTIKVALYQSDYTYSAGHAVYADIAGAGGGTECSGTGYTAGGEAITTTAVTIATNTAKFDGDDTPWGPGATISAIRYAPIYNDTPTSPADPLMAVIDFVTDQAVSSGTFTIVWNSAGIITLA